MILHYDFTDKKRSFLCCRIMDVVNAKPRNAVKMKVFHYDFTVKFYPETDEAKVPISGDL